MNLAKTFHKDLKKFLSYLTSTHNFSRNVVESFTTRVVISIMGVLINVIMARALGPQGRGEYAIMATIGTLGVQFGNLGLHSSNTYYLSKEPGLLYKISGNSFFISFALGSTISCFILILSQLWPQWMPISGPHLRLAIIWIPFSLAYLLSVNIFLAINKVRIFNGVELANQILALCFICLITLTGQKKVEFFFLSMLFATMICLTGLVIMIIRLAKRFPVPSLTLLWKTLGYGMRAYIVAFLSFLILRVDLLIIKYLLNAEQVGYYSVGVSLADTILLLPAIVGMILFPHLSRQEDINKKWDHTKRVIKTLTPLLLIIIALGAVLVKPLIKILFGPVFLPSVYPFYLLLPGILMISLHPILGSFLASIGYPKQIVYYMLITFVINILLNLILIPKMGIAGSALASSICYTLMFVCAYLLSKQCYFKLQENHVMQMKRRNG